eukprot:COSAG05_NODE_21082_length_274_cov_1.165714_1_plen_33_part_10
MSTLTSSTLTAEVKDCIEFWRYGLMHQTQLNTQ